MAEPTNHNEAEEVAPSTVEKQAPSVAEEHAPSTDSPQATDIPSANTPIANSEENPNAAVAKSSDTASTPDESAQAKPAAKKATTAPKGDKPAAKAAAEDKPAAAKAAKKEKAPAVEDKPFVEFIQQDYLPALQKALAAQGVQSLELTFEKQQVPLADYNQEDWWQVMGRWQNGLRQFNLYFPKEDIQGLKVFSCNEGAKPSTLEPFLGDERKITLDLMIYGVVQRLNGQKWLQRN